MLSYTEKALNVGPGTIKTLNAVTQCVLNGKPLKLHIAYLSLLHENQSVHNVKKSFKTTEVK